MTPDAFRRLGLFAASAVVAGGVAAAGVFVSWFVFAAAIVGGAALALLSTVELSPQAVEHEAQERGEGALRVRERRDIEASAARARDDYDDDD